MQIGPFLSYIDNPVLYEYVATFKKLRNRKKRECHSVCVCGREGGGWSKFLNFLLAFKISPLVRGIIPQTSN